MHCSSPLFHWKLAGRMAVEAEAICREGQILEEESAHQQADGREGRLSYRLSGPASAQGNVHRIDGHIQAAPHFPELRR